MGDNIKKEYCYICNTLLDSKLGQIGHTAKGICEDCYIDEIMPKMPKSHYDNDAEFLSQ